MSKKNNQLLSIGVVGCGGIGQVHLKNYQLNGAKITAVADTNENSAMQTAEKFQSQHYKKYQDMFENEKLDAISICTPTVFHKPVALDAFHKKIHVLCEKPLAMTVKECKEMVLVARKHKAIFMTAFCHRFQWQISQAHKWIQEEKLGDIVLFHNRFAGEFEGVEKKWFVQKKISGGGMFIDTLIHSIDLFRFLAGDAKSVKAEMKTFHPQLKIEDSGIIVLQSKSGALGTLEGSWQTPVAENVVEIMGTKGAVEINYNTGILRYWFHSHKDWQTFPQPKNAKDRFYLEIEHFLNCVKSRQTPLITGLDGLHAMEILEEAYSSAK